jgi:transcriptional regulator with XRE-family HTH domain
VTKFPRKSLFCDEHELLRQTLREERRARGLTQAEVAAGCGWPQSVIAKIEQGERRIDVVELVWLAAAMGAHPGRLFGKFTAKVAARAAKS